MNEVLNKLYEVTSKELQKIADKGSLTPQELESAKCAVELMHKIRHFEDDEEKYGWNEDGVSGKRYYSRNYPMSHGESYYGNNRNYGWRNDYSGAKEKLIREAERMMDAAVNDEERMAIMGYINRLNS